MCIKDIYERMFMNGDRPGCQQRVVTDRRSGWQMLFVGSKRTDGGRLTLTATSRVFPETGAANRRHPSVQTLLGARQRGNNGIASRFCSVWMPQRSVSTSQVASRKEGREGLGGWVGK